MSDRIHVLDLSRDELRAALTGLDLPAYRADQVRRWIFEKRVDDWATMSNLSRLDRARLGEAFVIGTGQVIEHGRARDGVHKLLIGWADGASSETVMIPSRDGRRTACISSQVGCPVGCRFCASGIGGLERNLTAGQIVEQVWQLARVALPAQERISNVVFMGIGEPLANYAAVVKAVRLINAPDGPNVGARKITISTIGLPGQIRKLAGEDLQVTLALSLHAPEQALRAELIPWAAKIPLDGVLSAARHYFERTGREITLEYVLLDGVNTLPRHADRLAEIAHSLRCNVNLICYNPVVELGYARPARTTVQTFGDRLRRHGINAHVRPSRGLDIDAACGQLRRRHAADRRTADAAPASDV